MVARLGDGHKTKLAENVAGVARHETDGEEQPHNQTQPGQLHLKLGLSAQTHTLQLLYLLPDDEAQVEIG